MPTRYIEAKLSNENSVNYISSVLDELKIKNDKLVLVINVPAPLIIKEETAKERSGFEERLKKIMEMMSSVNFHRTPVEFAILTEVKDYADYEALNEACNLTKYYQFFYTNLFLPLKKILNDAWIATIPLSFTFIAELGLANMTIDELIERSVQTCKMFYKFYKHRMPAFEFDPDYIKIIKWVIPGENPFMKICKDNPSDIAKMVDIINTREVPESGIVYHLLNTIDMYVSQVGAVSDKYVENDWRKERLYASYIMSQANIWQNEKYVIYLNGLLDVLEMIFMDQAQEILSQNGQSIAVDEEKAAIYKKIVDEACCGQ